MKTKTEHLDFYVTQALATFSQWQYPTIDIKKDDHNVFVGSGSAACAAELFTKKFGGIALNASNYKEFLSRTIDKNLLSVYIISASGGKDSIPMAEYISGLGLKPNLITCNPDAPVKEKVAKIYGGVMLCCWTNTRASAC